jgi:glycosyltransferase involved in cell wall biosynthesis
MAEEPQAQPHGESGTKPLVSIVIPCYRQAHLLSDAIESALAQTYAPIEIVVVDDGSPDDVGAVVGRYPAVHFIRQRNRGGSAARNAGLHASRGQYIVFLDGDDILLPHAVETGVQVLDEHPDCAFVHGMCDRRRLDGTWIESRSPIVGDQDFYLELLKGNCIRGLHAVVFRRAALEEVGGFDERRRQANDWDLYLRLTRRFRAYGHGRLVATYRRHTQNTNRFSNAGAMLRSSMAVLRAQRAHVRGNTQYSEARRDGIRFIRELFGEPLAQLVHEHVRAGSWRAALRDGLVLLRYHPRAILARANRKLHAVFR